MRKIQQQEQAGFTLVELAIVLTIVGLLIGGILKGQQLLQNSRVTATIAQINGFEAATTNFRDTYGELPGDLTDPDKRINSCPASCALSAVTDLGNGKVGLVNWSPGKIYQSTPAQGATPAFASPIYAETVLYWYELQQVGLISSVSDEGVAGGAAAVTAGFGSTIPAAKVGGGFLVGNISGLDDSATPAPFGPGNGVAAADGNLGRPAGDNVPPMGTVLFWVNDATSAPIAVLTGYTTQNKQALTPAVAAQVDRKVDDGVPNTGQVQAFGLQASCFGAAAPYSYTEGTVSKDCGLILRIQR